MVLTEKIGDFMGKLLDKARETLAKSIHTWIFKCFAISLVIEIVLEILGRRSVVGGFVFIISSPFVYLYNVSIIFFTLLFALFLRKRVFGMIIISSIWLLCGIVNFVVLGFRVTPFAAIDFLMLKDTFSMIDVYFKKWQQIAILVALVSVIVGLIMLFRKTPKFKGEVHVKGTMALCIIAWGVVIGFTNFAVKHNFISDDFANLGTAYKDYGFAYCFTNSIIDNGISKPVNYSEEVMDDIADELYLVKNKGWRVKANVIMIQLESFFDPNDVAGLTLSENPIPNFTGLKEKYPSGYLTVPAVGAGTANTEFEILTGIKSSFFGAGEYPFKTTLNHVPVDSLCSKFKSAGYKTYAIHNNKASFYDRINVYDNMGFDNFISLEYMYDVNYTKTGWAKDDVLIDNIMNCIESSEGLDFVYTISVQGHGRYPVDEGMCEDHIQVTYENLEMQEPFHYYVNQIYEMDQMIGKLVNRLEESGEEYILVLYGDHLPSLEIDESQLKNNNTFQTEYIIVNNVDIDIPDEDIMAYEMSLKLLDIINIKYGYAQKALLNYSGEELDDKLRLIAYDMLFGERYLYHGKNILPSNVMKMGLKDIYITRVNEEINAEGSYIVVKGKNFNSYSVVFIDDEAYETQYIDTQTLLVNGYSPEKGQKFNVCQVDKSHNILSTSKPHIY